MPASGWAEFFSGGHGGRPYFVHAETGATQWAEPSSYRLEQEAIDAAVFGVDIELVRGVMAPLRRGPESQLCNREPKILIPTP
jgi:hypothetical protein